jgi:hypothetical protein
LFQVHGELVEGVLPNEGSDDCWPRLKQVAHQNYLREFKGVIDTLACFRVIIRINSKPLIKGFPLCF